MDPRYKRRKKNTTLKIPKSSGRLGRRGVIRTDMADDPIESLLNIGTLAVPSKSVIKKRNFKGDYDILDAISTSHKRRLAGAQLTTSKLGGVSGNQLRGLSPDLLLLGMQSRGIAGSESMKPDEAVEWYFKQAIAGLDLRKQIREHPSFRKNVREFGGTERAYKPTYLQMQQDEFDAGMALRYEDEKEEFLKRSSDEYRESFRAQVFSDDNFIGSNSYEYDLAQKMRADAAAVSGMYDEANEASFRLAEEMEAGRRPISRPLTFKMSGTQGEALVSAYDTSLKVGQPAFIVDIDETLLTGTKKAGRIENKLLALKASRPVTSAEWYPWNEAAKQAKPIKPMIDFVKGLEEAGIQPVFMTARDEALREFTTERLRKLGLDPKYLYMRGLSQEQADLSPTSLKAKMLDEIGKRFNFVGIMDDSASVVQMALERGASFGMVPPKGGFDSIEASIQRGLETAGKAGGEAVERMNEAIRPIVSAGARSGKMSESTFNKILDVADMSKALLKGRL